jgi:hypothetical protein
VVLLDDDRHAVGEVSLENGTDRVVELRLRERERRPAASEEQDKTASEARVQSHGERRTSVSHAEHLG